MITLYSFGPFFGLPDASPFVLKTMMLLKLAGLDYTENHHGYGKAPKGKLPYIVDDGVTVADSTLIRRHIEKKYGFDFDAGLSEKDRAIGWTVEKMLEEHLYFALMHARWIDDNNFSRGPAQFFDAIPLPIRGLVRTMVRRKIAKGLHWQGTSRHSEAELLQLCRPSIDALATLLGDKPYFLGDQPHGTDATVFGFVTQALVPNFETPLRDAMAAHANLVAYRDRLLAAYFPDAVAG